MLSGGIWNEIPAQKDEFSVKKHPKIHARWSPTSYKWSYNSYKWPYKWATGVSYNPTYRGPPCARLMSFKVFAKWFKQRD